MAGIFTINQSYRVWETKGLAADSQGRLAISENNHELGSVLPEQDLVYLGRKHKGTELEEFHGVPTFRLPDGRVCKGHKNHFVVGAAYNQNKLATRAKNGAVPAQSPQTLEARQQVLRDRMAADMAALAELEAEAATNAEAEAEVPAELPEDAGDQDVEAMLDIAAAEIDDSDDSDDVDPSDD